MGARAVDRARLESVCTERYRGFESRPIRILLRINHLCEPSRFETAKVITTVINRASEKPQDQLWKPMVNAVSQPTTVGHTLLRISGKFSISPILKTKSS